MSRFAEAASLHDAIHSIRLRAQSVQPGLTEEQKIERQALAGIMCGLLAKSRDEAIELGISEWHNKDIPT